MLLISDKLSGTQSSITSPSLPDLTLYLSYLRPPPLHPSFLSLLVFVGIDVSMQTGSHRISSSSMAFSFMFVLPFICIPVDLPLFPFVHVPCFHSLLLCCSGLLLYALFTDIIRFICGTVKTAC